MNDIINGVFELIGGCLLILNLRRLWIDRKVDGVSVAPIIFFTLWGYWNLYFYPSVKAPWSFYGALVMVFANTAWIGLYLQIQRKSS